MTHAIIKTNIERILREKNWKFAELEKKVGPGRHVNNIFRGTSKNPTIEVLQSIAKALEVEIQELITDKSENIEIDTKLFLEACSILIKELNSLPQLPQMTYNRIFSLVKELYEYSVRLNLSEIDHNFAKWIIQQNYKN